MVTTVGSLFDEALALEWTVIGLLAQEAARF